MQDTVRNYTSFADFWPYYLSEHANATNRRVHVAGTTLAFTVCCYALITDQFTLLWLVPLVGYGGAWFGHFVIEKNRPATFRHPLYSLMGDFKMCTLTYTGQLKQELQKHNISSQQELPD